MERIARSAPCPCGSGKKYRWCCGNRSSTLRPGRHPSYPCLTMDLPGADGGPLALDWLYQNHYDAATAAYTRTYLAGLDYTQATALAAIPGDMFTLVDCNGKELLLAEGVIEIDGVEMSCLELVLGPDGPDFNTEQRGYLESLGRRHISFYEVVKSRAGYGLAVRDLVDEDEPVRWVQARELSKGRFRKRKRVFGARLMPGDPWKLSGALYATQEPHTSYLIEQIRSGLAANTDPAEERRIRSQFVVLGWLHAMSRFPPSSFEPQKSGMMPS